MTELSPEARAILEAARHAERPGPGDAARIHAAVIARVGGPQAGPGGQPGSEAVGPAGQAASGAGVGAAAGGGMVVKLLALVLVAGLVVAGGVWLAWPLGEASGTLPGACPERLAPCQMRRKCLKSK